MGRKIVATLGRQLESDFGRGFSRRNLFRMIRFAEVFPDPEIVSALLTQLGWTHFLSIIAIDDQLKRDFYAEMCRIERWSTRTLDKKIQSMLFERTALSRKPERLAEIELKALREEDRRVRSTHQRVFTAVNGAWDAPYKSPPRSPMKKRISAGRLMSFTD